MNGYFSALAVDLIREQPFPTGSGRPLFLTSHGAGNTSIAFIAMTCARACAFTRPGCAKQEISHHEQRRAG